MRQLANESDENLERQLDGFRAIGRDYAEDVSGKADTTVEMKAALDAATEIPDADELDDDDALEADAGAMDRAARENSNSPRLP